MKLLSVIQKDLKVLFKDRGQLVILFLLPLAFILPISFALGAGDGYGVTRSNQTERLPVLNYDGGNHADNFLDSLADSLELEQKVPLEDVSFLNLEDNPACAQPGQACDELIFDALLELSARNALLVIPEGFTDAIEAGEYTTITLRYDPVGDVTKRQQIESIVQGQSIKLSLVESIRKAYGDMAVLTTYAPDDVQDAVTEGAEKSKEVERNPSVVLETVHPSDFTLLQTPDTYQQTIPGYTVMFVFFIIGYLHSSIREERISGTFKRLLSFPVSRSVLLGGKLTASLIIGVLQVAIMFTAGVLIFNLSIGQDLLAFALLTIALVATATALGLAAATSGVSSGMITAPLIIGALLGGCMFPIDMMPSFLRSLSVVVPHSWALNGYQSLMVRGHGLAQVLPTIGVLFGFAAVFFIFAVTRFDFED